MNVQLHSFPELNRRAFQILCRELGIVDTLHYMGQLRSGSGNYTQERRQLFSNLTLDEYRTAVTKQDP